MILKAMVGLSLVVSASLDNRSPSMSDPGAELQLSVRQKDAAILPMVRRATDCIVRKVAADRRYSQQIRPGELNDLIVDAMTACEKPLRAMIDTHDRMYGRGSGVAFMLGPYLDVLPAAVVGHVRAQVR